MIARPAETSDDKAANRFRLLELLAVVLTAVGKILCMNVWELRLPYIIVVLLAWTAYVVWKRRQSPQAFSDWGLNFDGFFTTLKELLPWAVLLVFSFGIYGRLSGKMMVSWHILPIFLLYPIWGVLQQFLVLNLFGKNLKDSLKGQMPLWAIVCSTSLLFGLVHYPFLLLIGATFLLALVYTTLYFRGRNLIALGFYHGWLATFFFYWVLGRDSWLEAFG
ncbi:MAG: CPBP family glutamic-type intramembrane protease [Bacteroidota bacterium]